jgi:transcriptional regulator with XRE-family HTH domain
MFDGGKLKRLRDERKLTAQQLADICGVSRGYINQLESGSRQPSIETAERLSAALGISTCENPDTHEWTPAHEGAPDSDDRRGTGAHRINKAVQSQPSDEVTDVIPWLAVLGYSSGCVADRNLSLLFGEEPGQEYKRFPAQRTKLPCNCAYTSRLTSNGNHMIHYSK